MKYSSGLKIVAVISIFNLLGCASTGKTTAMGAGGGAGLGAAVGAIADPGPDGVNRVRNVFIGSAVGGIVGAGSGYLLGKKIESDRADEYRRGRTDRSKEIASSAGMGGSRSPRLLPPRTEARWVPDQVRGSTFIPGHFEYVILEGAKWESNQ